MQFWPRKRARREYPRIRSWPTKTEAAPLGFAGYKVGMTTVLMLDSRKFSKTKNEEVAFPVTVIECPPLKVASIRFYKKTPIGLRLATEIWGKVDKELNRRIAAPKKLDKKVESIEGYDDIRINVYTQPKLTGIGKKRPELFELGLGGKIADKFKFAQENLGKELFINSVFAEGQLFDTTAVTKGKGFQGPVKRFGVAIRSHKAEKTKRGPGSLGAWKAQGHMMYRVAHAGQMGYHTRREYNKLLMKISDKIADVNPKGGFIRYGTVRNQYVLVKGSVQGATKRLIRMNVATRPNHKLAIERPNITYVSIESKQR
jgi:large subunit ribosomal protein L3